MMSAITFSHQSPQVYYQYVASSATYWCFDYKFHTTSNTFLSGDLLHLSRRGRHLWMVPLFAELFVGMVLIFLFPFYSAFRFRSEEMLVPLSAGSSAHIHFHHPLSSFLSDLSHNIVIFSNRLEYSSKFQPISTREEVR